MTPTQVQAISKGLQEEAAKAPNYTYYIQFSDKIYLSPLIENYDPTIPESLCFFSDKIIGAEQNLLSLANDAGVQMNKHRFLASITLGTDRFKKMIGKVYGFNQAISASYFVLCKDQRLAQSSNSIWNDWCGFLLCPDNQITSSTKVMVRRY